MNKKIVTILIISTGFLLNACQKNIDIFVPDQGQLNGPDTSWYTSITPVMPVSVLKNNLVFETYTDSIQVNSNTAYILTPFGLQCGFPPNSCVNSSGQPVTGTVRVELMLIKKKGDMVRLNRPTTSNSRLLVSGGEIFIRLKKDTQNLQLAPNLKITFRYPDAPLITQMKVFVGDESTPNQFNWLPSPDPINNTVSITSQNYDILTNHLRWLNNGYFYDTTGISRTTITADLSSQFTNANTLAFVVFKDFRSVVAMNANLLTRKFSSIKLPVGKEITVIVISRQGNDYFMDHKTVMTVSSTAANQIVPVKPVITNLTLIKDYLNGL